MEPITLSREELYELVWETPTRHLCQQFGLSDVGLLTAVENGGAGRSKMVALGGVDLP